MSENGRIYIAEMAKLIDRKPHTIYLWLSEDVLPSKLKPKREGGRQKAYWTQSQVAGMREFAAARSGRWRGPSPVK
jgi:hypothetical protein